MAQQSELRLPAERSYLVVAKRTAAALATVAGFDLDAVDDLTIAVSQAFENAVGCLEDSGFRAGEIRLGFKVDDRRLEVTVRSSVNREAERLAQEQARAAEVREQLRLAHERQEHRRQEVAVEDAQVAAASDLALRLMGLFVDDSSYRRDSAGGLRVRLTKYRVS